MDEPHICHAHGCARRVPPAMFACKRHWFSLLAPLRRAIWREYRMGQEVDKPLSYRYMAVQRLAVMHTVFNPNDEEAAKVCAGYLAEAESWRALAIRAGQGDPLEGLV